MIFQSIVLGFAAFAGYLLAILVLLRAVPDRTVRIVVLAAIAFVPLSITVLILSGLRANLWCFAVSYCFFTLCFLLAFGAIYTSISLRILMDLLRMPAHSIAIDTIVSDYLIEDSFQDRLATIQKNGIANRVGAKFDLTPNGRTLVKWISFVQRLFNITKSG
jgi:hypothetical protein